MFGRLSILVIEVKFTLGTADQRLDAIAQVIAECDGIFPSKTCEHSCVLACNYANDQRDFPPFPVYGILCDGTSFEFFSFRW